MNDRLRSSQIRTQARLVHTMGVAYAEFGGDLITDLTNLEDPTGVLTAVHQARDFYAADLVSLFVAGPPAGTTGSFVIGLATFAVELDGNGQVQGIPELGFTVVEPFYDVANTFAHELDHNFGCQHDREHVGWTAWTMAPAFSRFPTAGASTLPGTIIPFYSNPQVTYGYTATGVADVADNARTMNASAAAVANLRRLPAVSITAPVPRAFETPTLPGQFTVARTGSTARATSDLGPVNGEFTLHREGDLSEPLTVRYKAAGTAVAGNRCKVLPGVATCPAGQDFVRVKVKPKGNAGGPGAKTNVKLTLQSGEGYVLGSEARAKVKVFGGG